MVKKFNKKGQITIFIILAMIIVVLGILIYMFYPEIQTALGFREENPNSFIQSCLQDNIKESVDKLSLQGGSINPEHFYLYRDNKIDYLCYTNEDYKTCFVQQPMLKEHVESEIKEEISEKVNECFDDLENSFKGRGYQVSLKRKNFEVELLPKRVVAIFNYTLSLKKGESTEIHEQFNVVLNNNLYELISIAKSIINWETTLGDAEIKNYMDFYRDLKVEKYKQSEGTTIYILTELNTGNKFQFASRSLVWPPGYSQ